MANFGDWLADKGIGWPDNLVAMTTVTSAKVVQRVDSLRKVPSKFKGLSCEPSLDLLI
jgi:protein gp37